MPRRKKLTLKRILKYLAAVVVFLTLPTLLLYGFLYFKYDEQLPEGKTGTEADQLANQMLDALNHKTYEETDYIEWTFKGRHKFEWFKNENKCNVYWQNNKVELNLDDPRKSTVFKNEMKLGTNQNSTTELIDKALLYFNNDSFWLVAPYKVFDSGVERRLVKTEENGNALLVTYTTGGSTPGDSYLWILDENKKPKSFKMWTSILPIDGLEASWSDWTTTETGAVLPTFHKLLIMGLEIEDILTR